MVELLVVGRTVYYALFSRPQSRRATAVEVERIRKSEPKCSALLFAESHSSSMAFCPTVDGNKHHPPTSVDAYKRTWIAVVEFVVAKVAGIELGCRAEQEKRIRGNGIGMRRTYRRHITTWRRNYPHIRLAVGSKHCPVVSCCLLLRNSGIGAVGCLYECKRWSGKVEEATVYGKVGLKSLCHAACGGQCVGDAHSHRVCLGIKRQ